LIVLSLLFTGCFTIKLDKAKEPGFTQEMIPLIKEMAEYSLVFSLRNELKYMYTDQIADRKTRKKMYRLGSKTTISYESTTKYPDSTVTFESERVSGDLRYEVEYYYDFSVNPVNRTNLTEHNVTGYLVKVTDRIYYRINSRKRERFPMM
jgi:hypothetical protein